MKDERGWRKPRTKRRRKVSPSSHIRPQPKAAERSRQPRTQRALAIWVLCFSHRRDDWSLDGLQCRPQAVARIRARGCRRPLPTAFDHCTLNVTCAAGKLDEYTVSV